MSPVEKLLRELIAIPSVNPAFLPEGHANAGEERIAGFLASVAAAAGLDVELQPVFPGRPNLLARLEPRSKARRRVLLAPHLDTVNAGEDQFTPRKSGGRIYGRGACDTKGAVAVMLSALCALARSGWRSAETEIVFAGLIDEEHRLQGSRSLVQSGFKADLAIVGEPTGLRLVTAHKGALWITFKTRGIPAHGSRPDLGRNAIHEMARIVDLLETDYAAMLARRRHPLLGSATINVGVINGGVQANIVPAECTAQADRRTLPGEKDKAVTGEIKRLLRDRGLRATLDCGKGSQGLPLETDPRLPLVAAFLTVLGQADPAGVDYYSDASVLARGGIPSVVFGPGNIAQAHTSREWVAARELEAGQEVLIKFLQTFA